MGESVGPSDHAAHDLVVVAEAADRGRTLPPETAACPDCAALHADLVALAAALPASSTPARPRDYRLTPADARRLRPGGWRRLIAAIGSSRDLVTRPLAIGFTTLGLAGLLVATVPGALPGGSATLAPVGAPAEGAGGASASKAPTSGAPAAEIPAPAPSTGPMMVSTAPEAAASDAAQPTDNDVFSGEDTEDPLASPAGEGAARASATAAPADAAATRDATSGYATLVLVAGACLVVGLGLFGLRWSARRFD